jgi:iron complex outermembrane receptor protein
LPRDIMLMASARYESGRVDTNNSGNLVPASKYGTVDFGGIIPVVKGMDLQAGVRNLFDRFYYYREGFPQPGHNWYFNMRYRF